MSKNITERDAANSFARLMRLGTVSHAQGDYKQAHHYWREAAMLQPENEQVWLALLQVLDSDADRRVCLQNILALNPNNQRAQEQLTALDQEPEGEAAPLPDVTPREDMQQRGVERLLRYLREVVLVVLITAVLLNLQNIATFIQGLLSP